MTQRACHVKMLHKVNPTSSISVRYITNETCKSGDAITDSLPFKVSVCRLKQTPRPCPATPSAFRNYLQTHPLSDTRVHTEVQLSHTCTLREYFPLILPLHYISEASIVLFRPRHVSDYQNIHPDFKCSTFTCNRVLLHRCTSTLTLVM